MQGTQAELDARNARFWDEMCGTTLAVKLGITEITPENLKRFDQAFLEYYPYFLDFLPTAQPGADLLEIGLGYGTGGQQLAERGFRYHGVDIAPGPCSLMEYRMEQLGITDAEIHNASVLSLPFEDARFDNVVSIGCLHHTGSIPGALAEVERVLKPGGWAHVMLYNSYSWRQLRIGAKLRLERLFGRGRDEHDERARFEINTEGEVAPLVEFVSRRELRQLFAGYSELDIKTQNFDPLVIANGRWIVPRERLLGNVARVLGLDLYITARK